MFDLLHFFFFLNSQFKKKKYSIMALDGIEMTTGNQEVIVVVVITEITVKY